jgi:hypothetical protein
MSLLINNSPFEKSCLAIIYFIGLNKTLLACTSLGQAASLSIGPSISQIVFFTQIFLDLIIVIASLKLFPLLLDSKKRTVIYLVILYTSIIYLLNYMMDIKLGYLMSDKLGSSIWQEMKIQFSRYNVLASVINNLFCLLFIILLFFKSKSPSLH